MKIHDQFKAPEIGRRKLPRFKGHVKLTLRDAKTKEVVHTEEGDNVITEALDDIFAENDFGCLDYNSLTPIADNWMSGILCYEQPFEADEVTGIDPTDYFIKSDDINHVVAHAGPTNPTDIRDDPTRGRPNSYLVKREANSVTIGWEWGPTQGNGEISALSLVHKDVGDCGTGRDSNIFKTLNPFLYVSRSILTPSNRTNDSANRITVEDRFMGKLDGRHKFFAKLGTDDDYSSYVVADPNAGTSDFNITIRRYFTDAVGFLDDQHSFEDTVKIVAHNPNFKWWYEPAYSWDYKNKTLFLFSNINVVRRPTQAVSYEFKSSRDWVQVAKVHFYLDENNKWAVSVSYDVIYPDAKDIGTLTSRMFIPHTRKLIEGVEQDIFYFPFYNNTTNRDDSSKMVRFNYQNQADVSYINLPYGDPVPLLNGLPEGSLIVGTRGIINGNTGYKVRPVGDYDNFASAPGLDSNAPATLANGKVNYNDPARWIIINKMIHISKYNLRSSVMKTASVTMEVEYTITQIEENEGE